MDRHDREIREYSGREREANGRAILDLEGRDEGEGLGGYHVKFVRQRSDEELPEGLAPEQIAIVPPYGDQVDRIRGAIDVDGLEIDTVDGFQG